MSAHHVAETGEEGPCRTCGRRTRLYDIIAGAKRDAHGIVRGICKACVRAMGQGRRRE